ncbi:endonuclease III [Victivallis sp. Marseille-Q1083]|uniref:endonuclease III n=1 Tax=Victivallis sp. Marseille-Q1083 TaxID=2717288 RepID=UPI001588D9D0|nr:endonuclease III [Victivallis sp. Marseille-Q1083]
MTGAQRKRLLQVRERLEAQYGVRECPLEHRSPFQLLVAVVLSAQCKDDRVNLVTKELFRVAPDAERFAELPVEELERLIHSVGLYRAKAANLHAASVKLVREFHGEVPRTMAELTALPGVGRKSANVILGNAFGLPGFPVDTHVKRVLNRLGVVACDVPEKIEAEVNAVVPPEYWKDFSHQLITLGRQICDARKPKCADCFLNDLCPARRTGA